MSLYADYITERTNDHIIEGPSGFVTYRYINEDQTVYIIDIYTAPEARKTGHASQLANQVVAKAKIRGATEMLGTVVPSAKGSTASAKVLFAYGMTLCSASTDLIIFRKDI